MERNAQIGGQGGGSETKKQYYCHLGVCGDIEWAKSHAESYDIPMGFELSVKDIGGPMWCCEEGEFVEDSRDSCGKSNCNFYNPCNGKSGRCRHLKNCFTGTGKFVTIDKNGIVEAGDDTMGI